MTILKVLAVLQRRARAVLARRKSRQNTQRLGYGRQNDVSADAWNAFWVIGQGGPIPK